GIYYGWIVVAVTFLTLLVAAGVRGAPGIIIIPIEGEFGWDRASISLAIAVNLVAYGLASPLSGRLINRFGTRAVTIWALVLSIVGTLGVLIMRSLVELNLWWGIVVGVGTGAIAMTLAATVATRWFGARRGLVTGILGAGSSAGQLVFVPAMMALTGAFGWRAAIALGAAALVLLCLPLVAVFLRNDPAELGLQPLGSDQPAAGATAPAEAVSIGRALRTGDFWLLAGSFSLCGFTTIGVINTHFIPHALEHGFTTEIAAGALAVIGAMNVVGTMASGYLTDKFNPRLLLAIYYGLRAASLVALPFIGDPVGLTIFAVFFGLDYIATVPPTVALAADRFGRAAIPVVFGWIFCAHQLGAAVSSYLAGLMRVWLGDYQVAFIGAGLLGFIAVALSLGISSASKEPAPGAAEGAA
ncbi:MAG TPA: MFS transporter, partial [Dehalococcoidia bacterium]|nr:MFS transporter [Dehalococcoidia bacterium]